jgi:hypothetical protein
MTDFVEGGVQSRQLPSAIQPGELAVHAIGRLDTMAEILVQSMCLRSAKFVSGATGIAKAKFQDQKGDYSGTNKIAAAHRAPFALQLDGRNAADLAQVAERPCLRQMVIAPQARTDLVSRPVNYADQLLENAISGPAFALFRSTIERQAPGQPLERNLLADSMMRMKGLLHNGFDDAAEAFRNAQRKRGWEQFRPGSSQAPLAGATNKEIDDFLDKTFGGGMKVQVGGPTEYGDLPEVILGVSQEITAKASPAVSTPGVLDAQIETFESAVRSGAIKK